MPDDYRCDSPHPVTESQRNPAGTADQQDKPFYVVVYTWMVVCMPASGQTEWMFHELPSPESTCHDASSLVGIFPVRHQGVSGSRLFASKWKLGLNLSERDLLEQGCGEVFTGKDNLLTQLTVGTAIEYFKRTNPFLKKSVFSLLVIIPSETPISMHLVFSFPPLCGFPSPPRVDQSNFPSSSVCTNNLSGPHIRT